MSTLAIGSIQVGAVEPIALPPPHGGGANWGDVWLSFAVDFNPQLIRIAIGNPDKWDLIQDNVIVPVGRRLGFRCVTGAEVASVIHRGASSGKPEEALPISYLLEVTKGP